MLMVEFSLEWKQYSSTLSNVQITCYVLTTFSPGSYANLMILLMDLVKVWHLSHTISCLCRILNSFNALSLFHMRIVTYCAMVTELSKKQLSWQFMKLHSTVFERVQLHPDQNILVLGHQIILVGSQWCRREMHQVVATWILDFQKHIYIHECFSYTIAGSSNA